MNNGRCRMHGGTSKGAPKGNKNALKHGRYTAEAISRRKAIAELISQVRVNVKSITEQPDTEVVRLAERIVGNTPATDKH